MNGSDSRSVASDDLTPGSASREKARSSGSALLSDASAGWATRSVSRSAGIDCPRATSSLAKAAAVVLKLLTRPLRAPSSASSAANVRCWPLSTRWMSFLGSVPRLASLARAPLRYASSQYLMAWLKPAAPLPSRPFEYSLRKVLRSSRVSDWRAVSTWPNWTGAAVWFIGIVLPEPSVGAEGEPGLMSTKKLPSRKMRERTLSWASRWIGRPLSLISMVTSAPALPSLNGSTLVTLPTSTPAIRTGDLGLRLLAVAKAALSSYGWANGLSLVNPKKANTAIRTSAIRPARNGVMPGSWGCRGFLLKSATLLHVLQVLDPELAALVSAAPQAGKIVVGDAPAAAGVGLLG